MKLGLVALLGLGSSAWAQSTSLTVGGVLEDFGQFLTTPFSVDTNTFLFGAITGAFVVFQAPLLALYQLGAEVISVVALSLFISFLGVQLGYDSPFPFFTDSIFNPREDSILDALYRLPPPRRGDPTPQVEKTELVYLTPEERGRRPHQSARQNDGPTHFVHLDPVNPQKPPRAPYDFGGVRDDSFGNWRNPNNPAREPFRRSLPHAGNKQANFQANQNDNLSYVFRNGKPKTNRYGIEAYFSKAKNYFMKKTFDFKETVSRSSFGHFFNQPIFEEVLKTAWQTVRRLKKEIA